MWVRLMESPIWHRCTVTLCEGGLRKGAMPLSGLWTFVWDKTVPWRLPWSQTLQFLPVGCWCPSSCCPGAEAQREWVCVSPKSIVGPLREHSWESCSFFCHPFSHWFLHPEVMGICLPGTGTLGWVVWCGAGNPRSRGIPSNFYPPHLGMGPPMLCYWISSPPICQDEGDFFNSLVVGIPYGSIFWWFRVIFILQSSCNFCFDCAKGWTMFSYTSILIRSSTSTFKKLSGFTNKTFSFDIQKPYEKNNKILKNY